MILLKVAISVLRKNYSKNINDQTYQRSIKQYDSDKKMGPTGD